MASDTPASLLSTIFRLTDLFNRRWPLRAVSIEEPSFSRAKRAGDVECVFEKVVLYNQTVLELESDGVGNVRRPACRKSVETEPSKRCSPAPLGDHLAGTEYCDLKVSVHMR